jgi:hypothetical protein
MTEKGVNYHQTDVPSNLSLVSMKGNKIARNIFNFRESEKGLKKTPGGLLFSSNPDEIEKNKYSLIGCFFQNLKRA